jgi:hypothetical protein
MAAAAAATLPVHPSRPCRRQPGASATWRGWRAAAHLPCRRRHHLLPVGSSRACGFSTGGLGPSRHRNRDARLRQGLPHGRRDVQGRRCRRGVILRSSSPLACSVLPLMIRVAGEASPPATDIETTKVRRGK